MTTPTKPPLALRLFEDDRNINNIPVESIRYRLKNGWSYDRIFRTPVGPASGRSSNPDHPYNTSSYAFYSETKLKELGVSRNDKVSADVIEKLK